MLGSGNVAVGYQAGYNETGNSKLYIESSNSSQPLIGGDFGTRKVGINRTMTNLAGQAQAFQVEGDAFKTTAGGNWVTSSDRRLKKNIVYLNSQEMLKKICALKGANYEWIDESKGKGIQYGFIAQELREVFPTKVYDNPNGFLSASYGDFDPMLVESIKALNDQNQSIKNDIEEMKTDLKLLKKAMSASVLEKVKVSEK